MRRDQYGRVVPPNPYDNLPEVGSTTEFFMTEGEWALLTADYLRRREAWLKEIGGAAGAPPFRSGQACEDLDSPV